MNTWLAVFVGGGAGSVLRYAISRIMFAWVGPLVLPWATLLSNLLATALLALIVLRWDTQSPGKEAWVALLAIGFCGGFSTFSTFSMENHALLRDGFTGMAILNIVVSVVAGILLFHLLSRSS